MKTLATLLFIILAVSINAQNTYYVSLSGNNSNNGSLGTPWQSVQFGIDQLQAGDTLFIRGGTYSEKLSINSSGLPSSHTTIKNYPGENPVIDAISFANNTPILWTDQSYLTIEGLHLTNNIFNNAEGLSIAGAAHNIDILNNKISNIKFSSNVNAPVNTNTNAVPLNIWADQPLDSIHSIAIRGNEVFNNQTGFSENITGGGNFSNFIIEANSVHDNTNIGIDITGNYQTCPTPSLDQGRYGIIRNNTIYNCVSTYSESAGIYIDGGSNIIVENNVSHHNGYGGEIGCEENGSTESIIFRNNVFYENASAGMHVGGYDPLTTGIVINAKIQNNTFYQNDTGNGFNGELILSKLQNCIIENNIFYPSSQNVLLYAYRTQTNLLMNYNLIFADAGASLIEVSGNWNTTGVSNFYTASGFGANSTFGNPLFANTVAADFHIAPNSSALDAGNPGYIIDSFGESDIDGEIRINNSIIDCGADEYYSTTSIVEQQKLIEFSVFPNPFSETITILGKIENAKIDIVNQLGEIIYSTSTTGEKVELELSSLTNGIYLLKVIQGDKIGQYKLIKK